MTIEEILKDIEENRLTNPRVAVVRTLDVVRELVREVDYLGDGVCAEDTINDMLAKAKESK